MGSKNIHSHRQTKLRSPSPPYIFGFKLRSAACKILDSDGLKVPFKNHVNILILNFFLEEEAEQEDQIYSSRNKFGPLVIQ